MRHALALSLLLVALAWAPLPPMIALWRSAMSVKQVWTLSSC